MRHHRQRARGARFLLFPVLLQFLVVLTVAAGAATTPASNVPDLPEVYRQDGFLMQALLQAAAGDFTGEGRAQLVLSGRNYETQENYIYLLRWTGRRFEVVWQSPNLWEPVSHLAVAVGDFTGLGRPQIAVFTRTRLRLFAWQDGRMELFHEETGWGVPEEIGVVRHPDHPYDLIAVSRQHTVVDNVPQKGVELLGWRNGRFRLLWETPTIGRVRAIAGGDLNGDGVWELVVEEGAGRNPGEIQVWAWQGARYERTHQEALREAPAFALSVVPAAGRHLLVLADDRGRAAVYRWAGTFELLAESGRTLGWAVASVAAADFLSNGGLQLAVVGYPSRLHVVQWEAEP